MACPRLGLKPNYKPFQVRADRLRSQLELGTRDGGQIFRVFPAPTAWVYLDVREVRAGKI